MSELRDKAIENLSVEFEKIKDKGEKDFAKPCMEYLKKRCGEDDSLCEDILQAHKTWEKCYKYVNDQAEKALNRTNGAIWHDTVYEWVEDYFHLDDKVLEEKKAKEEATKRVKEKTAKKGKGKNLPASAKDKNEKTDSTKKKQNEIDGQMDIFLFGL